MGKGRRILLVEDHADTARVFARFLTSEGFVVSVAGTLAAAWRLGQEQRFDLLIADLQLPDGTGWSLLEEPSPLCRTKAIAMTGYGREEDVKHSHRVGFIEHLVKPIDIMKLRAVIDRAIGLTPPTPDAPE